MRTTAERSGLEAHMNCRLASIFLLILGSIAIADAPFEDISYPRALEKAKADDKIVIIDFYTTWCPPCKMLDRITWPDPTVRAWLDKNAVCLKVDAEASHEFARRFKVRAYPTIVFIKSDGKVVDRAVGFLQPRDFLDVAKGAQSGKDAFTRARESFEAGDQNDPMTRDDYARKLVDLGKLDEALTQYLWCFDHGLEHRPSYVGVRVSFLLGNIKELADIYPPALAALKERRDRSEEQLRQFVAGKKLKKQKNKQKGITGFLGRLVGPDVSPIFRVAGDVAALNDTLGEGARSVTLYDQLKGNDRAESKRARRALYSRIEDDLLRARRYEDIVEDGDPVLRVTTSVQSLKMDHAVMAGLDEDMARQLKEHMLSDLITSAAGSYEACVGADRDDLAAQVKDLLIDAQSSFLTYDMLVSSAVRADRYDLIQGLADEAKTKLDAESADRIAAAVKVHLASPEAKAQLEKAKTQVEHSSENESAP